MPVKTFRFALALVPALLAAALLPTHAAAQERTFFVERGAQLLALDQPRCRGNVTLVTDVAYEGVKTTSWSFANTGGGGVGGRFNATPLLSSFVKLQSGCLNAHLSAMVGSSQTYGGARITLFQVTLTPTSGAPIAMYGHYPTPYGIPSPAIALTSEYDVDMLGANFYMPVGTATGQVAPGIYRVDVWWAGGPFATPGSIGAAFVLKLYQ